MFMELYACYACSDAHGGQKRVGFLELEFQVVVNCLIWMLGTKLSHVRTPLNH